MEAVRQQRAFVLVGPSASGKTDVAHYIAREKGYAILSADAMSVYAKMDIGTAKPTPQQRAEAPCYGIDLVEPNQSFTVGDYRAYVKRLFTRVGDGPLIITGGTGLYIQALLKGLDPLPTADPELRTELEALYRSHGLSALQESLRKLDRKRYERLADKQNPRRLIRAIELAQSGTPVTSRWRSSSAQPLMGITWEPSRLLERITQRVHAMYRSGFLDEARMLRENYPDLSVTARQAIGYNEAMRVLDETLTRDQAIAETIRRTRQLAKRQMTWFRNQMNVQWIRVCSDRTVQEIAGSVIRAWNEYGPTPVVI